ncbi:hypothetical protein WJ47_05800 [Burkholderia ubonensis]|uniref:Uncharacterized protein n=1 Tax=Burkholderia ubonensis TaxID=101571 RepID=A0AB73G7X0_9BURK|nr:PCYCGC motif-containing (lipo)protein [Burkholderia ubonensis]KVK86410.1 hypothetical protein WJ44_35250 [Burkholderia ubonensis]KVL71155.1 hypothetical protein WJ47_05800 [Burkholderia ubonensis]KVM35834.1 hypothetical protein WJ54_34305 [Burkholderia ubonensis]KVM39908.1 hypothetical protein WJ53_00575 [Burkholderia ubonensis]
MKRDVHRASGSRTDAHSCHIGKSKWHLLSLLVLVIAIPTTMVWGPLFVHKVAGSVAGATATPNAVRDIPGWRVGMLRPDGLRIIPSGVSDASRVLDPTQFSDKAVQHAYWVATQIPVVLNKLYCWCGCENRGEHRSNLQCFEDRMAVSCAVCQGTAEIAYQMTEAGIQDAAKIQAAVDAKWAPKG